MENIVEFKNVNKCFGRNKVIQNATFKIKKILSVGLLDLMVLERLRLLSCFWILYR